MRTWTRLDPLRHGLVDNATGEVVATIRESASMYVGSPVRECEAWIDAGPNAGPVGRFVALEKAKAAIEKVLA